MRTIINLFFVSILCTMSLTLNAQDKKPYSQSNVQQSSNMSVGRSTNNTYTAPTRSTSTSSNYQAPRTANTSNTPTYNSNNYTNYNNYNGLLFNDLFLPTPPPSYTEEELLAKSDKVLKTNAHIRPVFDGINVEYQKFAVNAQEETTLKMASGTTVIIPANTLQHSNGKMAQGQVEVQYREFHNTAELLASGIPMYDPKTQIYMQTAGMFELNASQNGQKLDIQQGKTVQVNMMSEDASNKFDVWQYNTKDNSWSEIDGSGQPQAKAIAPANTQQTTENLTSQNDGKSIVPTSRSTSNSDANTTAINTTTTTYNNNFVAVRPMTTNRLGLVNHDKALSLLISNSTNSAFIPAIKFDKKVPKAQKRSHTKFYLIAQQGKSVIPIKRRQVRRIELTEESQRFVAVLSNQYIATYTYQDYTKRLPTRNTSSADYVFKVSDQHISSLNDLQTVLMASK